MTAATVWPVFAVLAAVAAMALARPLLRSASPSGRAAGRADFDLAVFRRQLADLEADMARGLVAPAEASAARLEIERRILAAAAERERESANRSGDGGGRRRGHALAAALGVGTPALSLALYAMLGAPGEPDRPLAARAQPPAMAAGAMPVDAEAAMARLAERLREAPDDLPGWLLLARSYAATARFDEAAEAFASASALAPGDANIAASHGEALFHAAGGAMTEAAARRFDDALTLDPRHPGARYYRGVAALQAGDGAAALAMWRALAADAEADAPWLPDLRRRLRALAEALDVAPPPEARREAE